MSKRHFPILLTAAASLALQAAGCKHKDNYYRTEPWAPLGTISDPIWERHEENAEASDFVVHEHEWVGNTVKLNAAGEDHVKQIAARLTHVPFPVAVAPSSMTVAPESVNKFPVHGDLKLDMARRELIVRSLTALGVEDAEKRVVVAPPIATGFEYPEADGAYQRAFNGANTGVGAFGGFGRNTGFGGGFGGGGVGLY